MRVQFEFTLEDMIDATKRFLARSKVVRSWRSKELIWSAILCWGLVFLVFLKAPLKGAVFGFFAAVIATIVYPSLHKRMVDKRLGKFFKEKFGDKNSFICEVELTPTGYSTKAMNSQGTYKWESVEEIVTSEDAVSIFARESGGVIVRSRAFTSPAQQQEFFELANKYFEAARAGKAAE